MARSLTPFLDPPAMDPADVTALADFVLCKANADQQARVRDWLLLRACRVNSSTFHPDPIVSGFLQGKRQVGIDFLNAARTTPAAAKALKTTNEQG